MGGAAAMSASARSSTAAWRCVGSFGCWWRHCAAVEDAGDRRDVSGGCGADEEVSTSAAAGSGRFCRGISAGRERSSEDTVGGRSEADGAGRWRDARVAACAWMDEDDERPYSRMCVLLTRKLSRLGSALDADGGNNSAERRAPGSRKIKLGTDSTIVSNENVVICCFLNSCGKRLKILCRIESREASL
jgi:hypothetical protein